MQAKSDFIKLIRILSKINFADRYYQFYEIGRDRPEMSNYQQDDLIEVLSNTPLEFKYVKKDKFFVYKEKHQTCNLTLKVSFQHSQVDWLFHIETKQGPVGGPYSLLARESKQLDDPDFTYSPRSPRPHFSNLDELQEAVNFGISLFEDAKNAVLAQEWNNEVSSE
ncbi:MAG TPA: hypothetical protein VFZ66_05315 [Herpetosiphonaceae bacterium]